MERTVLDLEEQIFEKASYLVFIELLMGKQ